jgi:hypothetical protein
MEENQKSGKGVLRKCMGEGCERMVVGRFCPACEAKARRIRIRAVSQPSLRMSSGRRPGVI